MQQFQWLGNAAFMLDTLHGLAVLRVLEARFEEALDLVREINQCAQSGQFIGWAGPLALTL